jgi:putative addiction module CopG family antidote
VSNTAKTIELAEDLQRFAEERVRAGEYASVDDVANAAFRLLQRRGARIHEVREELGGIFREMAEGTYLEPTDQEFAGAVRARAVKHLGE